MCRDGRSSRSVSAAIAMMLSGALVACHHVPPVETAIVFDGQAHSITTTKVVCTNQPDGGLLIVVADTVNRTVRVQLTQHGRLVVEKAGVRYDDVSGFVSDPQEVTATKVDDTFTFSGRMPPNPGESQWHIFKIETTCPGYQDPLSPDMNANTGGAP